MKKKRLAIGFLICFVPYLSAFVFIHRSLTMRKPAANMAYWYYSDNDAIEAIQYYGFLPLRRLAYHIPAFDARHYRERTAWGSATGDMAPGEIDQVVQEIYGGTNQPASSHTNRLSNTY